jgi:uncharacterized membrane protein YfcA
MWVILSVSAIGFLAQIIDGSLGMAFGVSATSFLILLTYSPAAASAVVHLAEIVTTAVSGLSHARFGNIDWPVFFKIAVPGSIGSLIGALLLSSIDMSAARNWTSVVLLCLGVLIVLKFARNSSRNRLRNAQKRWLIPLGLFGGVVDATGGGGWGPIVTSSMTLSGVLEPRKAIGTSNAAEFAVALSASMGFLIGLGLAGIEWGAAVALMIGGVLAAPIAAYIVKIVNLRFLGIAVGVLVIILNLRQLTI